MNGAPPEGDDWFEVALLMKNCSAELPPDWDHGPEFLLEGVKNLAEAILLMKSHGLPLDSAARLLGLGGILLAQLEKETYASNSAASLLARLREHPQ